MRELALCLRGFSDLAYEAVSEHVKLTPCLRIGVLIVSPSRIANRGSFFYAAATVQDNVDDCESVRRKLMTNCSHVHSALLFLSASV